MTFFFQASSIKNVLALSSFIMALNESLDFEAQKVHPSIIKVIYTVSGR